MVCKQFRGSRQNSQACEASVAVRQPAPVRPQHRQTSCAGFGSLCSLEKVEDAAVNTDGGILEKTSAPADEKST